MSFQDRCTCQWRAPIRAASNLLDALDDGASMQHNQKCIGQSEK